MDTITNNNKYLLTIYKNRSPAKFHNRPQLNAQSS